MYTEHYVYKEDDREAGKTVYNMFLYKNPGLKKMLRFKLHSWGVQTLENIIKKDLEIKAKLMQGKEKLKETGEKIREKTMEQREKFKGKINEMKNLNAFNKKEGSDNQAKDHKDI